MKRSMPKWESAAPSANESTDQLHLYNSFTRKKELFKPIDGGNHIKWYSCGPTVYEESHMGHARCFISFDIMRRVLQSYFKYDITYCMNITDIDDKIITRARKRYLYNEYVRKSPSLETVVSDVKEAYSLIEAKAENEQDKDKKEMYGKMLTAVSEALKRVETAGDENVKKEELLSVSTEILSSLLDKRDGHNVTENSIFNELPRFYEGEFHKDMAALNILPPNVLTRVSEFVPEIVAFIERIINNGYAYASNGSVYFDTIKFSQAKDHYYAKLVPEAFGDSRALAEGEGELSASCSGEEKRNPADFALWKLSKRGEPAWNSPWGRGRPGWHIECSAMAGSVFGPQMDIHSGGVDLKFPHHDNELAQSEAAFGNSNWVNFFLHSGHLHIQGCKMSKSLKNFITIKDGLKKYTSRQIRILYLLHSWKDTLDYSDQTMEGAKSFEKTCAEFFFKVKDFSRSVNKFDTASAYAKFTPVEAELLKVFGEKRAAVHKFLCDSINTAATMKELISLVSATNTYMSSNYNLDSYNHVLVRDIANYITNMLTIFGVIETPDSIGFQSTSGGSYASNLEETLMPYLNALSKFRDEIRAEARANKQTGILDMCDKLRDEVLPRLGVGIEDLADRTIVKLSDPETLMKEKEAKRQAEEEKKRKAEENKREQERKQAEKEAKSRVPPNQLFVNEKEYSKFDENGIPTHDQEGKEISKSLRKKLEKAHEAQKKVYEEYLSKTSKAAAKSES